jgi:D-alanine-D-alanine ligase
LTGSLSEFEGDGPYIVKPRYGGSSIGIDVVADLATAKARLATNVHLRRGAVIEPYRADLFDLQIGMMSYPELTLSAIERPIRSSRATEILDYRDKYVGGSGMDAAARELPAKIDVGLEERIREYARRAALALGVRGVARVDFLSDGEHVVLNEINTIPGSLSRHLFVDPVIDFEEILLRLLREAVEFPAARYNAQGADGVLLRDAKSIATKLG